MRFAGALLILMLAACSKQEPPPVAQPPVVPAASPAKTPGAVLPHHDGGQNPPPTQGPPPSPPEANPPAPAAAPEPTASTTTPNPGEEIFTNTCATCHMADGGGVPNMQPSIIGSAWISNPDPQLLLSLILRGATVMGEAANAYDNKMPPVDNLSDAEIAAVATFVRSRFAAGPITVPVTPDQVAIARKRPGLPE